MSIKLEGVPETISRADYLKLIRSVGLNPSDIISLEFGQSHIAAVIIARHPATGEMVIADNGVEILKHEVIVHVEDEGDES